MRADEMLVGCGFATAAIWVASPLPTKPSRATPAASPARSLGALAEILRPGAHVLLWHFVVDLQADAWLVGQDDVAVLDHRLVLDRQIVPAGVVNPVPFHNQEVRNAGADVGGGHGPQRTTDVMRRQGDVVDLGHV